MGPIVLFQWTSGCDIKRGTMFVNQDVPLCHQAVLGAPTLVRLGGRVLGLLCSWWPPLEAALHPPCRLLLLPGLPLPLQLRPLQSHLHLLM